MQVTIIPADDAEPIHSSTADVREIVGGYVQSHPFPGRQDVIALLNEDGKRLSLPVNRRATLLLAPVMYAGDVVVGDVVIAGFDQVRGRVVSCPPDVYLEPAAAVSA